MQKTSAVAQSKRSIQFLRAETHKSLIEVVVLLRSCSVWTVKQERTVWAVVWAVKQPIFLSKSVKNSDFIILEFAYHKFIFAKKRKIYIFVGIEFLFPNIMRNKKCHLCSFLR